MLTFEDCLKLDCVKYLNEHYVILTTDNENNFPASIPSNVEMECPVSLLNKVPYQSKYYISSMMAYGKAIVKIK